MTEVKLSPDGSTIMVFVPIAWRRRGGRKVIVAPPGCDDWAPPPKIDRALLKALARAHRWQRMLEEGCFGTLAELAEAERISRSYVSRILRLTLLGGDQPQGSRSFCSRSRSNGSGSRSSSRSDPAGHHSPQYWRHPQRPGSRLRIAAAAVKRRAGPTRSERR